MHVVDPVEIVARHLGRMDRHPAVAHRVTGDLRQRLDLHEPLQRQPRLDHRVAPRTVSNRVQVRPLLGDDQSEFTKRRRDGGPRLEPVEPLERSVGSDDASLVHDRERRQTVPLADLEVVGIVGGCHLHRTGAEGGVDVIVGNDRDTAAGQRQLDLGAHQMRIAFVVGMHRDGGVAEHGLDPGGCHGDRAVTDRDQLALVVRMIDFNVRQGGEAARTPVDDALGPIDQAVVVEPLEDGADRTRRAGVHREALTRPVDAVAEPAHLGEDPAAVLGLPLPDPLDERLPTEVFARHAFLAKLALDHVLRRDAGMIHARQPERLVALHAPAPGHGVHQGVLGRVPHVQLAGDVRRRQHDRERRLVARRVSGEIAPLDPPLVQLRLDRGRQIDRGQAGRRRAGSVGRADRAGRVGRRHIGQSKDCRSPSRTGSSSEGFR